MEVDAIANRVKRVATGWEPQLTIAIDSIIDRSTVMELCEHFFELNPPTRLKLRGETLSGTLEALISGQADLSAKLDAQVRGLGVGFLPTCVAQSYLDTGRLVEKKVERAQQKVQSYYVWRQSTKSQQGRALQWWLGQLQSPTTRSALLGVRIPSPASGRAYKG